MSAGLLAAMVFGGLIAVGMFSLVLRAFPAQHVDASDAFARITPPLGPPTVATSAGETTGKDRLGVWAVRALPPVIWARTPLKELAILRIPLARFYADKLIYAGLGLLIVPTLTLTFAAFGLRLPVAIPAVASLGLAAVMFFLPNYNAVDEAKKARTEFKRSLGLYADMVAVERQNGSGARQAMEAAAEVGDSWVFRRLAEELRRSGWSGMPPWDALEQMAKDFDLPDLQDFADIMRMGGTEGAPVYDTLRARTAAMRSAMLHDDKAAANAVGERMSMPASLLGVIFMALLIAPAVMRMLTHT